MRHIFILVGQADEREWIERVDNLSIQVERTNNLRVFIVLIGVEKSHQPFEPVA